MTEKITELSAVTCGKDLPITEVLARLTDSGYLFQLIVDAEGVLQGTFTDADMRRAILGGATTDSPVSECMQTNPIVGHVGEDAANLEKLATIPGLIAFLPIVDSAGRLQEVWLADVVRGNTPALIMAGGPGSRLGELTADTPKPLLPIGGRPILDHILEGLEHSGIRDIFISVHYLPDKIQHFVSARENAANIELLREEQPLGTAGALARLPRHEDGDLLVINGDLVTSVDFGALETFHRRHSYDATITVASYAVDIPYGVVRHDEDGLFRGIDEKPQHQYFVAAGIYMLSPSVTALVTPEQPLDMPELLNRARGIGLSIGVFPVHEYWRDVGRPDQLAEVMREHGD